jgi:hypothetical protein
MSPVRAFSVRLNLLMILLIPALLGIVVLWLWLVVSASLGLWRSPSEIGMLWSRIILIGSWSAMLFSILLPGTEQWKRNYGHYGLVNLLTHFRETKPDRHDYYWAKIMEILGRWTQQ